MSIRVHSWFNVILFAFVVATGLSLSVFAQEGETAWHSAARLGGCGGLYILAEPGELWIEIEKADRNRSGNATHLRAVFFGPDREVIAEEYILDDGQAKGSGTGRVQRIRFSTRVARAGVYGVNITTTTDRYGTDFIWGFTTNSPKYLVETSRGHKDERHQEPLVLENPDAAGNVCFLPRPGAFEVNLSGVVAAGQPVQLFDGSDRPVSEVVPDAEGLAALTVNGEHPRDGGPWRLHLPVYVGTVEIDGVTRWDASDGGYENLSLWSPDPASWFEFHENRWLLTPYRQRRNLASGDEGSVQFEVHNNGRESRTVALALEFPGDAWSCTLSTASVELALGASETIEIVYRAPESGGESRVHVRATAGAFSTYSTLFLTPDAGTSEAPLALPLVLQPYRHENEQFGYAPDYPVSNQVYFDRQNTPVITGRNSVFVYREGAWHETAVDGPMSSKVAFDADNDSYLLTQDKGRPALLHSRDSGVTFTTYPIPGQGGFDLEQFSGHNAPSGPPPFVRNTLTARDPNLFWRRMNDLDLFLPEKTPEGTIRIGEPIRLSALSIGVSAHSGIPSTIVSRDDKVHVVWGEATDPEVETPGVPTYVATWDRSKKVLTEPALVGHGAPANDTHNTPSITMDSQGYLHVLVGTHGRTFQYARSLQPNDAAGGWTEPEPLGPNLRQTYVGFVCDRNDTLHVVFRLWHTDTAYFPAGHYATLSYMRKEPGQSWSAPQPLIVSAFSEYSVFYHRLTIDRAGELFLSYDYWSTFWFYRTDRRETRRALLASVTGGQTWKLATTGELAP